VRGEHLARIADISRDLVDSMSDIVWAINPRRDHVHDLAERMRRYACDVCSARQIELRFRTAGEDRQLGADVRRQVLLILKESMNNLARHSGASEAEVELCIGGRTLALRVVDNAAGAPVLAKS
jgi:signal transduction histidine kinase